MRNTIHSRKKFLAFLLAVSTITASAAFASCKDDTVDSSSSSSSSSSATTKDDGLIKNAGFEKDSLSDSTKIATSVTGWSRSVNSTTSGSALSSKSASGMVDTADSVWKDLTENKVSGIVGSDDKPAITEDQASDKWKSMSTKDKLEYYEAWEKANKDSKKDLDDLKFYQSFNIDAEDLPTTENPRTHDWTKDKESEDTQVLMIHNHYYTGSYETLGTAQKFTSSSSVTVKAGTAAEFSVWVKTADLQTSNSYGDSQAAVDKGAYISITNTLGGTSLDPLLVKNINTEGVEENNGWVQYSFYLRSATYADTTFTVVLGLGEGGGSDRGGYVNGYAFFDDIQCKTVDETTFVTNTGYTVNADTQEVTYKDGFQAISIEESNKTFYGADDKSFVIDYVNAAKEGEYKVDTVNYVETVTNIAPTTETRNTNVYTAAADVAGVKTYTGLGLSTAKDFKGVTTAKELNAVTDNDYVKAVAKKHFTSNKFVGAEEKVLMLLSANGAAYTAKSTATYEVDAGAYTGISFFVKTSALNSKTGAGITLVNGDQKETIASIDTTTVATVDIDDETKDVYDGWVQCFFFVSNETEDKISFSLEFTYGPTTVVDTTKSSYASGFAAFTKFEEYKFANETAFDCAASGTYAKKVSLVKSETKATGDKGFDETIGVPTDAIEQGYAIPKNYKGVYSNSAYVDNQNTSLDTNKLATSGLLNKEHAENYTAILETLGGAGATWNSVFGNSVTQPLVIYNATAGMSYGYIGADQSIGSEAYKTVSFRIKTNATAYVYLIDTTDSTHKNTLSLDAKKTYFYNDDGDVCSVDPTSENFNARKHVAFKLQSNGLYKVSTTWVDYDATKIDKNAYYANFSAYEVKDGNLVTGENAVTYAYTGEQPWTYGQDGVAFYGKDGKYYADKACKVLVKDFSAEEVGLKTRTDGFAAQKLMQTVTDTQGEWVTVTFHIHTGSDAKNFRLEVWCGDRASKAETAVTAGSYLFLDSYDAGAVDEKFATLVANRAEELRLDSSVKGAKHESVFSFYDTDKFLRYDAGADANGVGNSFDDYRSSAYNKGIAFLTYSNGSEYEIYADYTYSETVVAADVEKDDTTDSKEEETTTGEGTSVWLLASSIVIAAVLVFAVASLIVRKVILKARKKNGAKAIVTVKKKDKKNK